MKTHLFSGALAAAMLAMTGCASDGDNGASSSKSASTEKAGFTSKTYSADGGDVLGSVKRALSARGWQTLNDAGTTIDARQVGRKQTSDIRVSVSGNSFTISHLSGDSGRQLNSWVSNVAFDTLVFTGMDRITATERAGRKSRKKR